VIEVSVRVEEGDGAALRRSESPQDLLGLVSWIDDHGLSRVGVRDDRAVALDGADGEGSDERCVGHGSSLQASGLVKD
jgi:hypothetical protein